MSGYPRQPRRVGARCDCGHFVVDHENEYAGAPCLGPGPEEDAPGACECLGLNPVGPADCAECNGRGRRAVNVDPVNGPEVMAACPRCKGTGAQPRRGG